MEFCKIGLGAWPRKETFDHYVSEVPCTYSMTVKLDITVLRRLGVRLYPAMLYALTTIVNRHPEFRTALDEHGQVGVFSQMLPCYTVFHRESETFSNLWTEYHPDFARFLEAYQQDLTRYGHLTGMAPKPHTPANTFPVSMVPWASFEGFNLNLQKGYDYLLPIFTMGKFYPEQDRWLLPLAIQVHHGVCDGFHLCRFVNELQDLVNDETFFG
ncbi:type A chloramphenicol O-acetyltransferase [uncultured Subdoligranulum sp.]|uniref:type A chloramphenicol O-acetyltransferase n=1 Tax=uncultured Subdoligranulum sp. TaxID=512298 RepID=UPI002608353B|nr:type A chloramphenicol O-acetyltransferase [uncultured Subdoligranulum sp.]